MVVCRSRIRGNLVARTIGSLARTIGSLAVVAVVLCFASPARAGLISFEPKDWNADEHHLYLNGGVVQESVGAVVPGHSGYVPVRDVATSEDPTALGFSAAGADDPDTFHIYQHVTSWTLPTSDHVYKSVNETGHTRTYQYMKDEIKVRGNRVRFRSDLLLNGRLILARTEDFGQDASEMVSFFEVEITRENGRRGFYGSVELVPRKNGKIVVRTRGKIRRKDISQQMDDGKVFQVVFDNVLIPYTTVARLGQEFSLTTTVRSEATNIGDGTGSEVIFGPGTAMLPEMVEKNVVPEPATVGLLGFGGGLLGVMGRGRRRARG